MRAVSACLVLLLAALPAAPGAQADATGPESAAPEACAATRDKALGTLDEAKLAIEMAIDNDIAIAGSPEYELLQTKDQQDKEIERERLKVWERYRRCVGKHSPPPAR